MNDPAKTVLAGVCGGVIVLAVMALTSGAIPSMRAEPDPVARDIQTAIQLIQSQGAEQIGRFDKLSERLDSLETARAGADEATLESRIAAVVDKAMIKAGVDKASLADRVKAVIREIAKQSAVEPGQANVQAPSEPAGQGPDVIGQPVSDVTPVNADLDHILGDPEAAVSLIVYDDFECPFCRRHHPTLKQIAKHFAGQVNVVFRQMPLAMHGDVAMREAMISECVAQQGGNDAFWTFADGVFDKTGGNGRGLTDTAMDGLLSSLGMKPELVYDCVENNRDELQAAIDQDMTEAQRLGIAGTPGNVLVDNASGEALRINGARPLTQFVSAINAFLNGD